MIFKKILFSLLTLGVAGGAGGGIYYVINNKDGNKPQEKSKEKFLGYLVFKEGNKTGDNSDTSKVYEVALEENLEGEKPEENKVCKLGSDNSLICKVSDIDKEKTKNYLEKLVSSVKGTSTEELQKALKGKLTNDKEQFKSFFKGNIYEEIEKLFPHNK